ncbi:MAG TPA: ABC transporter transmembrane domain-containing protein, partial [Acidimicrobiales bacterium]
MAMRGHGMGGARGGPWAGMRSFRQDRAVLAHRVKKGTTRRMLGFAMPYRKVLTIFMPVVILDAVIGAVNPLVLRALLDDGILKKHEAISGREHVIIWLAALVAALALFDAGLSLFERRISAYIGEGLIFDMRAKVFRHIQRMPLAFFTRTQTGALISRLNNDVIGAQQAFTDLLSNVVGNLVTVSIVL